MTRILLVEDESHIVRALTPALEAEGYQVSPVATGAAALEAMAGEGFDLVLLDLGLPDMDGKQVIERIREWSEVPIIVVSARHLEEEKIAAFDLGADDYVDKPFAMGELLARLRATQRGRDRRFSSQAMFSAGTLTIDFSNRRVWIEDQPVHLTPKEYDLTRTLARYAGRVVTHRQIAAAVWGGAAPADNQSVRVLVAQLRQKIERNPARPLIILTEQGLGYRLTEPPV